MEKSQKLDGTPKPRGKRQGSSVGQAQRKKKYLYKSKRPYIYLYQYILRELDFLRSVSSSFISINNKDDWYQ